MTVELWQIIAAALSVIFFPSGGLYIAYRRMRATEESNQKNFEKNFEKNVADIRKEHETGLLAASDALQKRLLALDGHRREEISNLQSQIKQQGELIIDQGKRLTAKDEEIREIRDECDENSRHKELCEKRLARIEAEYGITPETK